MDRFLIIGSVPVVRKVYLHANDWQPYTRFRVQILEKNKKAEEIKRVKGIEDKLQAKFDEQERRRNQALKDTSKFAAETTVTN